MPASGSTTLFYFNLALAAVGAVMSALVALPIAWLVHVISGSPGPLDFRAVLESMKWFALFGVALGPMFGWMVVRRMPLWRATLALGMVAGIGGALGTIVPHGVIILPLVALGASIVALLVQRRYAEPVRQRMAALLNDRRDGSLPEYPSATPTVPPEP